MAYFTTDELRNIGLSDGVIGTLGTMSHFQQARRGWEFTLALIGVLLVGALLVCMSDARP
jgi:hypothetical protein